MGGKFGRSPKGGVGLVLGVRKGSGSSWFVTPGTERTEAESDTDDKEFVVPS